MKYLVHTHCLEWHDIDIIVEADSKEEARELSKLMIKIGEVYGREVRTILSDMNTPLGKYIGNKVSINVVSTIIPVKSA